MDQQFAASLRSRILTEKSRTSYPIGFPPLPPIPAARYCDPEFFKLERDYVFGKSWLMVAHVDELPAPGDVMLLEQFHAPIILVRGEDSCIRAFYNTCRHRGAPLIREPRAQVKTRLVCQYHSWSYDLTGALTGVPDRHYFGNLNRGCLGLRAINCDTWAGMVFINFDLNAEPLRQFLAPVMRNMDEEIGDRAIGAQSHFVHKSSALIRGNWKLATDANIETYHVNTVHRASLSSTQDQRKTTMWLLDKGHSRMFIGHHGEVIRNPLVPRFKQVNPVLGEGQYAYLIYPNTVLAISETVIFTAQAWPVTPGEMRYDACYMMAAPKDRVNGAPYDRIIAATERILKEDLANLSFMQASFEAGAIDSIPLSYQERRIYYLHESIDRSIGAELIPSQLRIQPILEPFIEQ
jgi:phenylpropionate dioxygenase-like ring-hydroxylating dioxygenase large terminal subunit